MTIVETTRRSRAVSTPTWMCTSPRRWTPTAACWASSRSRRRRPATRVACAGCAASGRSSGSASRAPARTGRAGPVTCAATGVDGGRGRPPQPSGAPPSRQVRQLDAVEAARAALSGRALGDRPRPPTATWKRSGRCWSRKRSAREARIKSLEPDPPPRLHRPRRAAGTVPRHASRRASARRRRAATQRRRRPGPSTPPSSPSRPSVGASSTSTPTTPASTRQLALLVRRHRPEPARGLRRRHRHRRHPAASPPATTRNGSAPKPRSRTCAASHPLPASSGKTTRHRLNRGGNRQANHALWRIVFTRMSTDARTRAYVERRLAEGRSKREIIRVLKRYVAREVYPLPRAPLNKTRSGGPGPIMP